MKVEINSKHGRMVLPFNGDYIAQQLINYGEYEWYVVEIIKQLSQGYDTGIILDIGTNIGTVSLPLARDFPKYQIHSFEIQPVLIETIKENIALNNLTNITKRATMCLLFQWNLLAGVCTHARFVIGVKI